MEATGSSEAKPAGELDSVLRNQIGLIYENLSSRLGGEQLDYEGVRMFSSEICQRADLQENEFLSRLEALKLEGDA